MDLVVEAAVAIADEEGLAAVSMATVAKRCGFTTMSLYRHVASKDELVWRMLDRGLGPAPELTFDGWRDGLDQWAHALMAVLRVHPWGIDIPINGTLPTFAQLSWLNRGLEVLDGVGLDPGEAADLVLLLNGYVFWASRLESSLAAVPPQPLVPPQRDLSELPYVRRAIEAGSFEDQTTPDENFQSGLDRTLDGIGVLIAQRSSPRPEPPSLPRTSSKYLSAFSGVISFAPVSTCWLTSLCSSFFSADSTPTLAMP